MDWSAKIRKHESELGCPIAVVDGVLECRDPELGGQRFRRPLGTPSQHEINLKIFHEEIYHARGRQVYRDQKGLCAMCGTKLNQMGEIDHKEPRAKGRDDRKANLHVVCSSFVIGGCHWHRKKHGVNVVQP